MSASEGTATLAPGSTGTPSIGGAPARRRRRRVDGHRSVRGAVGGRTITIPHLPVRRLAGIALVGVAGLLPRFLVYLAAFTPLTAARDQQRLAGTLKG